MPTNFNDVAQSANCKELNFTDGKTVTEVAIPMPTQPMWVGAVTTGYAFPAKTSNLWLDTTAPSPQIQHFAFKFWIRNWISPLSGLKLRFQPIVFMSFRRPR